MNTHRHFFRNLGSCVSVADFSFFVDSTSLAADV